MPPADQPIGLLVVMDPIAMIEPSKDSTLAMLLEAQSRGWCLRYAELGDIWLRDGEAHGRLAELRVTDDRKNWFELEDASEMPLRQMDVILMRKDPPFDMEYVYARLEAQRDDLARRVERLQAEEREETAHSGNVGGEYGVCAVCGNPIEPERLELIPEAVRCAKHA